MFDIFIKQQREFYLKLFKTTHVHNIFYIIFYLLLLSYKILLQYMTMNSCTSFKDHYVSKSNLILSATIQNMHERK